MMSNQSHFKNTLRSHGSTSQNPISKQYFKIPKTSWLEFSVRGFVCLKQKLFPFLEIRFKTNRGCKNVIKRNL